MPFQQHCVLGATALLLVSILVCIGAAPFTKVEESFNIQAVHDMLFLGGDLQSYDHKQFPGVVPRTFLGAASLATAAAGSAYPLYFVLGVPKVTVLVAIRATLGLFSWACLLRLGSAVSRRFNAHVQATFLLLCASQFHLPFYASRTLPNTLALSPVTLAMAHWLDGQELFLTPALLTAATLIFRCDMLLLLAPVSLELLLRRRMGFWMLVALGVASAATALAATVTFDSWFWGRWLWPEGEVLWFNTVLNKSKEWGVLPWHWYFTAALPKTLMAAYPFVFWGVAADRPSRPFGVVLACFLALYSCLGHKEVRFLLPVVPMLNVLAAVGIQRLISRVPRGAARTAVAVCVWGSLAASASVAGLLAYVSHHNYPGGEALMWLNGNRAGVDGAVVHLDTYTCMTGVSRFLHTHGNWTYVKDEREVLPGEFPLMISEQAEIAGYRRLHSQLGFQPANFMRGPAHWLQPLVHVHERVSPSEQEAGVTAERPHVAQSSERDPDDPDD